MTTIRAKPDPPVISIVPMITFVVILLLWCSVSLLTFYNVKDSGETLEKIVPLKPMEKIVTLKPVNQSELLDQFTTMINKFYKNRKIAIKRDTLRIGNNAWMEVTLNSNFFYNFINDLQNEVMNNVNDNSIYLNSIKQILRYDLYSQGKSGNINLLNSIINLSQETQQYLLTTCKIVTQDNLENLDSKDIKLLKLYAEDLSVHLFSKWMTDFYSYLSEVRELRNKFNIEVYNVADLLNVVAVMRGYKKEEVIKYIDFVLKKL